MKGASAMLYFGITLRSRAVARDWAHVVKDFNRTLYSAYRQTDGNFRILVACHELPDLEREYDSRVEFLQTDVPVPSTPLEMMQDKGYKLSMIGKRIRELGGGYTMVLDADDLVSNRVAEYVNSHPGKHGFVSRYGYIFNMGDTCCRKAMKPDQVCGSCLIVNYRIDDLPAELPESPSAREGRNYIIRKAHPSIQPYLKEQGRELSRLPFPSTVYMRNTGDNHSMLDGGKLGLKRRLEQALQRKVPVEKVADEFGLFL